MWQRLQIRICSRFHFYGRIFCSSTKSKNALMKWCVECWAVGPKKIMLNIFRPPLQLASKCIFCDALNHKKVQVQINLKHFEGDCDPICQRPSEGGQGRIYHKQLNNDVTPLSRHLWKEGRCPNNSKLHRSPATFCLPAEFPSWERAQHQSND